MSEDFFLKFIIVGNTSVGKSAILERFIRNKFSATTATVGVEYRATHIEVENKSFGLMIWDTAGMEAYRSFTQAYYRSTAVALFVYDITKRESFDGLQDWIDTVRHSCEENPQLISVIIGNKTDLKDQRQVELVEGQELAATNEALFFEVSASSGENIGKVFETAAQLFYQKYKDGLIDIANETHGLVLGPRQLEMGSRGGNSGTCQC